MAMPETTAEIIEPWHHKRKRGKYWDIIADRLSNAGFTWGCVATVDRDGQTIFVADAHLGNGKRFVARADEKLTAFVELESAARCSS
jgi:hypothetical protein